MAGRLQSGNGLWRTTRQELGDTWDDQSSVETRVSRHQNPPSYRRSGQFDRVRGGRCSSFVTIQVRAAVARFSPSCLGDRITAMRGSSMGSDCSRALEMTLRRSQNAFDRQPFENNFAVTGPDGLEDILGNDLGSSSGRRFVTFPQLHRLLRFGSASFDKIGERSRTEETVEKFRKGFAQALVGKQLVAAQIGCDGLDLRTVLNRSAHALGKRSGRHCSTARATPVPGPVFCHFKSNRRQIEDLSVLTILTNQRVRPGSAFTESLATRWTRRVFVNAVIDNSVGCFRLMKRFTTMSFLATLFFTRFSPQTFWLRRVGKVAFVSR